MWYDVTGKIALLWVTGLNEIELLTECLICLHDRFYTMDETSVLIKAVKSNLHEFTTIRRRLDFVVYGATPLGEALCCDVTLVAPLTREGRPQPSAASRDGAAITVAERRKRAAYPELLRPGSQRLCVLACEVGGRWSSESLRLAKNQLAALLPYVRQFYASDSTYVWQDASGQCHEVRQSEAALYAIAQHPALAAVHAQPRQGEAVFAYFDDIYVVAVPERIRELQDACQRALREHACIELNRGKTRVWNAAGEEPAHISDLRGHGEDTVSATRPPRPSRSRHAAGYRRVRTRDPCHEAGRARTPPYPHPRGPRAILLHYCAAPRANYPRPRNQFAADCDALLRPAWAPSCTAAPNCCSTNLATGPWLWRTWAALGNRRSQGRVLGLDSLPAIRARSPQIADNLLHASQRQRCPRLGRMPPAALQSALRTKILLLSPVCPPTTAKCLHLCLCAAVVRPARMCRCACLRKQPPTEILPSSATFSLSHRPHLLSPAACPDMPRCISVDWP
eukprot:s6778_g1.t1